MLEIPTYSPKDLLKQTGTKLHKGVEIHLLGDEDFDLIYRIHTTKETAAFVEIAALEQEVGGRQDPDMYL